MNISKHEPRGLHELAVGGDIHHDGGKGGKIRTITFNMRTGHVLADCTFDVVLRLKKRRFVRSQNGQPYRVSSRGIKAVRAQLNQR